MPSPEEVIAKIEQSLAWNRQFLDHAEENFVMPSEIAQTVKLIAQDELILSALKAYTGKPVAWLITGGDEKLTVYTKAYADYYESLNRSVTPLCPSLAEEGQEGQSSHLATTLGESTHVTDAPVSSDQPLFWTDKGGHSAMTNAQKLRMIADGALGGEFESAARVAVRFNIPLYAGKESV